MGQFETLCFEKKHQTELLTDGKIVNVDVVASAIKEGLNSVVNNQNGKEVLLILPQQTFSFFRTEVPTDIAPTALDSFIKDKARATLTTNIDENLYDYFIEENGGKKQVSFYAINKETLAKFYEVFNLLEIKISSILPETLCYFKLFKKTLRKDKTENIFYATYTGDYIKGYLFDSYGLLLPEVWESEVGKKSIESLIKQKAEDLEKDNHKLNRLIISGEGSESIRQDTFTKEVGVWTNPLKRIIPNFYEEYLKLLVSSASKPFPILTYDACFGAFIFSYEHRNFSFLKNGSKVKNTKSSSSPPSKGFPAKEFIIFLISFSLSFLVFIGLSKMKPQSLSIPKTLSFMGPSPTLTPSPTPNEPTPTPSPAFKKDEIKIKVLNGAGTKGKATEVKNILDKSGYGEVLTGNADNFDYTNTEIQVKKDKAAVADMLKSDLKPYTTKIKVTTLADKEVADVVLIFGSDFK